MRKTFTTIVMVPLVLAVGCAHEPEFPARIVTPTVLPMNALPSNVRRPNTQDEAITLFQNDGLGALECPFGIRVGECAGLQWVGSSSGFDGESYYFDRSELVGYEHANDTGTGKRYGNVPEKCERVVRRQICATTPTLRK
jgi:hypothetical protein